MSYPWYLSINIARDLPFHLFLSGKWYNRASTLFGFTCKSYTRFLPYYHFEPWYFILMFFCCIVKTVLKSNKINNFIIQCQLSFSLCLKMRFAIRLCICTHIYENWWIYLFLLKYIRCCSEREWTKFIIIYNTVLINAFFFSRLFTYINCKSFIHSFRFVLYIKMYPHHTSI